jgi:hypothetical protein
VGLCGQRTQWLLLRSLAEIRIDCPDGWFRVMYVAKFEEAVYGAPPVSRRRPGKRTGAMSKSPGHATGRGSREEDIEITIDTKSRHRPGPVATYSWIWGFHPRWRSACWPARTPESTSRSDGNSSSWFRIRLIGSDLVLVPFPTPLLDLGIVGAQVVSTLVGTFQPPNFVRCCEPSPLESGNHRRWSGTTIAIASSQPFKLYGS